MEPAFWEVIENIGRSWKISFAALIADLDEQGGEKFLASHYRLTALDGLELTRHVKAQYPGLPVIMTSGNLHPSDKMADVPFMSKPYDLPKLAIAIRELIDQLSSKDR